MKLFDKTLTTLEKSLDARLLRQNVLSGNLANANTPAYQPKDVDFTKAMEAARKEQASASLAVTSGGHMSLGATAQENLANASGVVIQAEGAAPGIDGNAVDVDRAMVDLAQNALQYGASAKAAGKKLAILRYVASDGAM
jgi:flagellar basal-body rod protein FlgB